MHRSAKKLEDSLSSGNPSSSPSLTSSSSSSSPSKNKKPKPSTNTTVKAPRATVLYPTCLDIRHCKPPVPLLSPVAVPRSPPPQKQNSPNPRRVRPGKPAPTNQDRQKSYEKRQHYMLKLVLGSVDLEKYVPVLLRNGINYLDFLRLTPADLTDIGIRRVKDRQKIFECIEYLANQPQQVGDTLKTQSQSLSSPLRIQRNDAISSVMQIQILNNIWAHLLTLAGVRHRSAGDPNNNIFRDKAGKEYKLGIAGLRQQILIPANFRLNDGIQILDLIEVSDSVLDQAETLAATFRSLQMKLLKNNIDNRTMHELVNGDRKQPSDEGRGVDGPQTGKDEGTQPQINSNVGFYRIFMNMRLELGFGLICCIGLLFVKKHA